MERGRIMKGEKSKLKSKKEIWWNKYKLYAKVLIFPICKECLQMNKDDETQYWEIILHGSHISKKELAAFVPTVFSRIFFYE